MGPWRFQKCLGLSNKLHVPCSTFCVWETPVKMHSVPGPLHLLAYVTKGRKVLPGTRRNCSKFVHPSGRVGCHLYFLTLPGFTPVLKLSGNVPDPPPNHNFLRARTTCHSALYPQRLNPCLSRTKHSLEIFPE